MTGGCQWPSQAMVDMKKKLTIDIHNANKKHLFRASLFNFCVLIINNNYLLWCLYPKEPELRGATQQN